MKKKYQSIEPPSDLLNRFLRAEEEIIINRRNLANFVCKHYIRNLLILLFDLLIYSVLKNDIILFVAFLLWIFASIISPLLLLKSKKFKMY